MFIKQKEGKLRKLEEEEAYTRVRLLLIAVKFGITP